MRKLRRLPIAGEVLVKEGDTVGQETTVARTSVPGRPHVVNVAQALNLDTEVQKVEDFVLQEIGGSVKKDEPLAHYRAFFGLINKTCVSPVAGTLESISQVTGNVIVREMPIPIELAAYVPGIVSKVIPREGVIVQTKGALVQGVFGIGGESFGLLHVVSKTPKDVIDVGQITEECSGKIVVGGALVTAGALRKAVEVGAKGVVVGGMEDIDLVQFLGYDIGVAITGHENVGITLVLTEGFGRMEMLEKTFLLLTRFNGSLACINGTTQIRAGVIRPEVIIPRGTDSKLTEDEAQVTEGLTPGTVVRIIREPYFGAIGRVVSLPAAVQKMESESDVRILEVELENGQRVTKARANVEIIEE